MSTEHDDPSRRGVWPAIGAPSEQDLVKDHARARRQEVLIVVGFMIALALIAASVCWCINGGWFS